MAMTPPGASFARANSIAAVMARRAPSRVMLPFWTTWAVAPAAAAMSSAAARADRTNVRRLSEPLVK
jgi:hypothetical protein